MIKTLEEKLTMTVIRGTIISEEYEPAPEFPESLVISSTYYITLDMQCDQRKIGKEIGIVRIQIEDHSQVFDYLMRDTPSKACRSKGGDMKKEEIKELIKTGTKVEISAIPKKELKSYLYKWNLRSHENGHKHSLFVCTAQIKILEDK